MLSLTPSRRRSVKILAIGSYTVMAVDIIQGLVFVPLYLTYIGERMYGLWLGTGGILAVLAFLDMGMASLTIQRVSREFGLKNYDGVSKYFFGGLIINTGFMSILLIAGLILSLGLDGIFHQTTTAEGKLLTFAFQIALVELILALFNNTIEGTLNALQKSLMGKIFQFTGAIIGIVTLYLLLLGKNPLLAIPIGLLVRSSIALIGNVIYLVILFKKNNIRIFNYDKDVIREYLKLTPSLMLSKFGTSLVSNIEPTLINMFISPEVAVYFSVTKKAGGLIRTILDRIGGVLYPSMAHLYSEKGKGKFAVFFINLLNFIIPITLMLFLILILLNKSFVSLWVGEENYLGDFTAALISFSLFTSFISNFLSYLLSTTGDIKFTSKAVFWESIVKLVSLFIMLWLFGINGLPIAIGAVGTVFSYIYIKRWNQHLLVDQSQKRAVIKEHISYACVLIALSVLLYVVLRLWLSVQSYIMFFIVSAIVLTIMTFALFISSATYKKFLISKFLKTSKYESS
jgi:O-antigen/teichoic acid export membrane protein